jgi:CSLREA domain-containing protein
MKKILIIVIFCFGILAFGAAAKARAATFFVNSLTDTGAGSGTIGDLRYCITQAQATPGTDTITVTTTGTVLLQSSLPAITESLSLSGSGASFFIVNGQHLAGVTPFIVGGSGITVTIGGLTIRGGHNTGFGGGLIVGGGTTLNLNSVTIDDNEAQFGGGGIYGSNSTLNIANSRITNNRTNMFGCGGGIYFSGGALTIRNSTISGNACPVEESATIGGALSLDSGSFGLLTRIDNSTISGNISNSAAIFTNGSELRTSNTTVSSNVGGGLLNNDGSLILRNSTVAGNQGAGIVNISGNLTIANLIAADNTDNTDLSSSITPITALGTNIVEHIFLLDPPSGGGTVLQVDPQLNPLGNNDGPTQTQSFRVTSPARNAGATPEALDTLANPLATDQRVGGFARVFGGTVDIGAYELATATVTKTADTSDGVCDADCSLREAILTVPSDGVILFAPLFNTPQTITLGTYISIEKFLTVLGPGADKLTISGGGTTSLFENFSTNSANLNFSGLTFANGNGTGGNNNFQGGAIETHAALTTFDAVVFRNNTAAQIAGALVASGGLCRISNSAFVNNTAAASSAVYQPLGRLEMSNTTVSGNAETDGGYGALYLTGNGIVRSSTIVNNSGWSNLYLSSGNFNIGSTIVAGTATNDIYLSSGSITSGGGNLLGRNPNASATFAAAGTPNANLDYVGTVVAPVDPRLAPLGNYGGPTPTHALLQNSPALDHGRDCVLGNSCTPPLAAALVFDQRGTGAPRKIGAAVDIGAFERNITFGANTAPNGTINIPYNFQMTATRQTNFADFPAVRAVRKRAEPGELLAPTSFALLPVAGQSLPPGLNLSPTGLVSGTPSATGVYNFTVQATDTDGSSGAIQYQINILSPTAASVSIGGRVQTVTGNGIRGVSVTLTDAAGNTRTAVTTSFGSFRFDGVAAGRTYILAVTAKKYRFDPPTRIVNVTEDVTELDFTARE